ncbi:hypothetical protein PTI98_011741 [Pleurotus ostreatus]|nr:hypothetical protein PTI98_011741 [Pleurotus ostreatus]
MDDAALAAEQLALCMNDQHISFALSYASGAIFLYDFLLTFPDELSHMWRFKRVRAGSILFFIARYGGFTSAIICFLPVDVALGNVRTCMRLITIVSSDAVLAVRTWAIWERRKSVLLLLLSTALGAIGAAVFILEKDASTSKMAPAISPLLPNLCSYIESDVTNLWSIPYFLTIMYETITLVLTLAQILRWRQRIPASVRSSLSDALWKDGVTYFAFMLVLSIINIGLVFQVTVHTRYLSRLVADTDCQLTVPLAPSTSFRGIPTPNLLAQHGRHANNLVHGRLLFWSKKHRRC